MPSKSNKDNPKIGRDFENQVRLALKEYFNKDFSEKPINIGSPPKPHKFDAVSDDESIVVECKNYTWTETGNAPSAKFATLNEAVLYLSKAPENKKKIIVLKKHYCNKRSESLAEYYFRRYRHLLDNISIMEFDLDDTKLKVINK